MDFFDLESKATVTEFLKLPCGLHDCINSMSLFLLSFNDEAENLSLEFITL